MERSEKKLAELEKALNGGRQREIETRVGILRSETPFEGALMSLAKHYDSTDDKGIRLAIAGLFNDLKDKSVKPEVVEAIGAVSKPETKAMLASSCWQSGLDYSEHAREIAGFFMNGDYMTSLECFSVRETCADSVADSDRTGIIFALQQKIDSWDTPMKKLAGELIVLLKG
jgi:hypothetical protein